MLWKHYEDFFHVLYDNDKANKLMDELRAKYRNIASDYTGIGVNRLRLIASKPHSDLILWVGSKKMFKRKKLDEYLENATSI